MDTELFASLHLQEVSVALIFGIGAFALHLVAYGWYAIEIFHGSTRPNMATWFMWLFGAWVEFLTYDAIDSHWSTSALPFACMLGVGLIFLTTTYTQVRKSLSGRNEVVYEKPDRKDYYLISADVGALMLYLMTGGAAWANFIAVSTSIVTFIPMWKTMSRNQHEQPGPWMLWSLAYLLMFGAVVVENSDEVIVQSFYPLYYFILHSATMILAFKKVTHKT